jgi:hypothetical protein
MTNNGSSGKKGFLLSSDSDLPLRKYHYHIYITLVIEMKKGHTISFGSLYVREGHTRHDLPFLFTPDTFLYRRVPGQD